MPWPYAACYNLHIFIYNTKKTYRRSKMKQFFTKNGVRAVALVLSFALVMSIMAPVATVFAIGDNVLHVTDRANSWDGIDIHRDGMEVGDMLTVEGRIDGPAPAGAQMVLGGAESPWNWVRNVAVTDANQGFIFEVVLEENHIEEDQFVRIRVQTNGEGAAMPFFIYTITHSRGSEVLFTLAEDTYVQGASGETNLYGVDFLQRSGGPVVIANPRQPHQEVADTPAGGGILHVTNRTADWNAIDIHREPLQWGDRITVTGRTAGIVPDGTQMLLGGASSPWNWITSTSVSEPNEAFTLSVTLDETHFVEDQFERIRIQSNSAGAEMSFFIDNIAIVRSGNTVYELAADEDLTIGSVTTFAGHEFLQISGNPTVTVVEAGTEFEAPQMGELGPLTLLHLVTFGPDCEYVDYVSAGALMEGAIIERNGNHVFRLENVTGNYTSGDGNYLHFALPAPLPMGSTVEISWDVFVPSAENPGNRTIVGPGININGQFGSAPHQPTNVPHGTQPADLDRVIPMDEWVTTSVEFTTGLAVGDIDFLIFRFRVNNNEQQPRLLYVDNISISTRGVEEVFVPTFDLGAPSLAELFADYFMIGNIWSNAIQMGMGNTEAAFQHHFNAVTAENHHKPSFIAGAGPDPATWNFETQDAIVDFAEEHGLAMVGHTLVWHAQSPAWLTNVPGTTDPVTRAQAMANMELYISTVAGRYAGRMQAWDVLNEAIASSVGEFSGDWRNHLRTNLNLAGGELQWYTAFANGAIEGEAGYDFIFYAFYFARQADPHATLFYNDYNEEQPGKSMAIADMVMYFNQRWENHPSYDGRMLIEGIGMQSHHHLDQWATNFDNIRPTIERFVATGAVLAVTELDITVGTQANPSIPLTAEQEARQAAAYARVFGYLLEFADYIERVSIWGKADNQSWRAWGSPLLFDGNFEAKAAFDAIVEVAHDAPAAFHAYEYAFRMVIGSTSGFYDLLSGENLDHLLDVPAQVINGGIYVPFRALFLAFDNDEDTLSWDSATGEAVLTRDGFEDRFTPDHVVDGRGLVSLEFLRDDGLTVVVEGDVITIRG